MTPTSSLDYQTVARTNEARCALWHPGFPDDTEWSLADWSNAVAGEVGELCNVVKKIRRHEGGFRDVNLLDLQVLRMMAGNEMADVILYTDLLATKMRLNLSYFVAHKFNEKSIEQGFPQRLVLP